MRASGAIACLLLAAVSASALPSAASARCRVTRGVPGTKLPAAAGAAYQALPVPYVRTWYGNASSWVRLPKRGIVPTIRRSGRLETKFPWWRAASDQVRVKARLLGRPAAAFAADVGTASEYGPTGFVPSGLTFSRAGCWRLTASVGRGRPLSFVVRVVAGGL